ncbi:MAG: hypothetical protein AB3N28_08375 [Kordiimonas sp.]
MANKTDWAWHNEKGPRGNVREAVALFDSEDDMQAAVYDLESQGFSNAAISRPVPPEEIEAVIDHPINSAKELEDDSSVPRQAFGDKDSRIEGIMVVLLIPVYVALLIAAGIAVANGLEVWQGVIISLIMGSMGLLIGGLFSYRIARKKSERTKREQEWGGLLLWVRTGSTAQEHKAIDILRKHAGRDVHLHGPAHSSVH